MADKAVASLTAASALGGTELFYADDGTNDVKVTATQIKTWTSASPALVTPALGVATATSVAIGGATIGTNALAVTGTSALGNTSIGAGVTQAAWTTSGIRAIHNAGTYVDSSSSGTVAAAYTDLFGASTINSSSATTFTKYYGAYFVAPIATGNVTMTNKSALGADTISIGGAAQSTNALAVTGTSSFTGAMTLLSGSNFDNSNGGGGVTTTSVTVTSGNGVNWSNGNGLKSSASGSFVFNNNGSSVLFPFSFPASASLQLGAADAAAPVAQTLRVQSVIAGTADTAGADWTIDASVSTGAGVPGNIVFKAAGKGASSTVQNTLNSALTIRGGTTNNTNVGYPSVIVGAGAALATTATDGFLYIPTCAGAPAGTPTAATGAVALVYDTTNNKFYVYNGAWKGGTAPGVWS